MSKFINPIEATYRYLKAQGKEIIKLFSGNPNEEGFLFPPEILKKSYNQYFEKQIYHPQSKGLLKAREAIAKYYQEQNVQVDSENILLTSGTSESFFYLFSYLCQPGDNILTPNPAYPLFDYIAELAHIELRHYPLLEKQNWEVDIAELKRRTDEKTKAIVLISPNNPTGSVISAQQIQEIVSWANEKEIPLICDEVFSEFYFPERVTRLGAPQLPPAARKAGDAVIGGEERQDLLKSFPRAIKISKPFLCFTLNGISKMFALPSMKLGWIVVTGEKEKVEKAVDALETTADTFLSCHTAIQEALPSMFSEGWNFVEEYKKEVGERRKLAIEILRQSSLIEFVEPQGAFYLMMKIGRGEPMCSPGQTRRPVPTEEQFVIDLMKQKNVFIHPGYFYDYEDGIHGIISFLCEREKLKTGLGRLLEFIK